MKNLVLLITFYFLGSIEFINLQTLEEFINSHYENGSFNQILGKVGSGEIRGSSSTNLAIKVSDSRKQCLALEREYKYQLKVGSVLVE